MKRNWWAIFLGAILVAALHGAVFSTSIGQRAEFLATDLWFNVRGAQPPPSEVVFLALDELSYNDLSVPLNQAWPRRLHAHLLERLSEFGARGVVFDILFADEGADPEGDALFAAAIKKLPVVLGAEASFRSVRAVSGSYMLEELQLPYPPFEAAAKVVALVGLPEDRGIVRRFLTARTEQTRDLPSLSEAAAMLVRGALERPGERDLINYYGPSRSIPTYSVYQAIQTEKPLPASVFKDKVVFVGVAMRTAVGPAQKDVFGSPYYGELVSGTEIHATAAANLIAGDWISRNSFGLELVGLSIFSIAASGAVLFLSPVAAAVLVVAIGALWFAVSYVAFLSGGFVPGIILVGVILPLLLLGATLVHYLGARRQTAKIKGAFELYLSPAMAEQMSRSPDALKLGGEKIYATALFTDIANFSSISEELPAERVAAMLNSYFTELMDAVIENEGTLIKFIGDAIFVLWGAPIKQDNHAERAVRTALVIERKVTEFNSLGKFPPLHTRIGINTGPMVVGNLGSARRFDYTAVGDAVNLASRVEGANKYLGTSILLTESTRKELGAFNGIVPVGSVQVLGKRESVGLFTVVGSGGLSSLAEDTLKQWNDFLEAFRSREWERADQLLAQAFEGEARGTPALPQGLQDFYRGQIAYYRQNRPPQGWRGEVVFEAK